MNKAGVKGNGKEPKGKLKQKFVKSTYNDPVFEEGKKNDAGKTSDQIRQKQGRIAKEYDRRFISALFTASCRLVRLS
jgi:hypothetical protein